jgi:transcription termination factor NusB
VPVPVIINEYIELSRDFLDERDVKFINGILDSVAKDVRK